MEILDGTLVPFVVDRSLLKERAYDVLKEEIVTGRIAPGTFLSERQLATRLGMSKTPIKAALERLESDGYVRVSPQQGILVRELAIEEVMDLFDIRLALEPFVVGRLAGRLTEEQYARLVENLEAQDQTAAIDDRLTYRKLDIEFHYLLCEFQGNREIQQVLRRLQDRLYRVILRVLERTPGRIVSGIEEHRRILEAIRAGDALAAMEAITTHLEFGRRRLAEP